MAAVTEAPPLAPAPETKPPRKRGRLVPYWLLLPGILWLIVFFALPMIYQASTSVQTGSLEEGYKVTWHFATYWDALSEYWPQFLRSVAYAAAVLADEPVRESTNSSSRHSSTCWGRRLLASEAAIGAQGILSMSSQR